MKKCTRKKMTRNLNFKQKLINENIFPKIDWFQRIQENLQIKSRHENAFFIPFFSNGKYPEKHTKIAEYM